ncbi:MAG: DUF5012 domain-containing protein [Paludibacter sp.]|nr:DUF5012 domain-containing protein [Paludibacter sp.]
MMMWLLAVVGLVGCHDITTDGYDKVTYYPTLNLQEEGEFYVIPVGGNYVDPGYSSFFNGEDVTSDVNVVSNVNTSEPGMYEVSYSVTSTDGFVLTKVRNVVVAGTDPLMTDLSGAYKSNITRVPGGDRGPFTINLGKLANGLYTVEDFLGGWYWYGSGYGQSYGYNGVIFVKSSGEVVFIWSNPAVGWSDGANLTSPAYNAATHTFTWAAKMNAASQYVFNVTLVKQ